ncbi:MAG: LytTR family transcriptional regulator DNA-binding domain-containing protein [Bacteroidota bacterium]|nr:LytTR family transcriptional regulator DNA-binding domain-containing protein [Bacteroidota bacterium]
MPEEKIVALIVEDDPVIGADLKWFMKDFGYAPLPPVRTVDDALLMLETVHPDLILIDVTLEGDRDGIHLAEIIREKHDLPIIFITAHHDRKTIDRIKSTRPSAYLVKPIDEHNLQTSIELALYNHSHQKLSPRSSMEEEHDFVSGDHFFIKVKNQLKKVLIDDILMLEAYDNYSYLYTSDQKHLISSTLKSLEQKLPSNRFLRVHRSYIVQLPAVEGIQEDVILIGDHHIPIGKTYREDFMKRIDLL